ncbi:MAG TPA: LCP family protein [Actinomycetota bacterium]|nr:LCP family protein [Actinomycetota bacterium]
MLRALATSLVVVGLLGAGGIAWFYNDLSEMMTRVDVKLDAAAGGAMNVLVIGSDSRAGVTGEDIQRFGRGGQKLADTIIIAQIVPAETRGTLLHFPRDLWVDVAGGGKAKINSSYARGPQAVIDTVQDLTGIPINHYIEVDFHGFRRMVDAIGGIDVCLDERMYDPKLNFRLPAGHNHLEGNAALTFVRSRHSSGDGDFGRIRRQQQFMRAVVQKVGRPTVMGNPLRVKRLGEAFAQNATVDPNFNLDDMLRLALSVKRVGVDQIATLSVPGRLSNMNRQSVVIMDERKAQRIFEAMRDVRDPARALAPHVAVEDASGRGLLEEVSQQLEARGFVVDRKETVTPQQRTVVSYPKELAEEGHQVADHLPDARRLNRGTDIVVLIGSDFEGLAEQAAPQPGGAPAPAGACG